MPTSGLDRTIVEIKPALAQAVTLLSKSSARIRKVWTRLLERHGTCGQYSSALAGLHLATRIRDVILADARAYREASENQGQDLARRRIPAECVAAAIALYVESCLPHLLSADRKGTRWAAPLTRWASVYQFFVLSGYARYREAECTALEEKVATAQRRAQDFSVEIANAYEKERRRLAQDLHDDIGHDLIVLKLYTQVIALDLKKGEIGQLRRKLRESVSLIKHALQGVRHLTFDLGPAVWNEQGFIPAIQLYVRQFALRTGIRVNIRAARMKGQLSDAYETALYRVLQGALSNIAAHAGARRVRITLECRREEILMRVEDDGKGFNVGRKLSAPPKSYGLRAMQDRMQLLGGSIQFSSRPARQGVKGRGTTIEFHLPLHGSEAT